MQLYEIVTDENLRELTVRGEPGFPFAVYDNDMALYIGRRVPWHWHREIEFVYVTEGRITVDSEEGSCAMKKGQAFFLNANTLHSMHMQNEETGKFITIVFDPLLISGTDTSVFYTRYVLPMITGQGLSSLWLCREDWHAEIRKDLMEVCRLCEEHPFGCEIMIRERLSRIWLTIFLQNKEKLGQNRNEGKNERLKKMLLYLQQHLSERITLKDIADAAHVSTRECTRCFRDTLRITPVIYLTQLRVRAAAARLLQTSDPITDIAVQTGFESPSYFSKVFHQYTGCSPREYRKRQREGLQNN
ncbi:MAG: AraC family transcriptional regulator [Blautia sp.]|nr:AraC family transcriptional regulator [Blautia sp.]